MSDLGPVQIEAKLRDLVNDLTRAQIALSQARDAEVTAKHTWESARRTAAFSPECPKPSRGGVTVAQREEWLDAQTFESKQVYDIAAVRRESAADHLRTLRDQAMVVMALSKSVLATYSMAGVQP